MKKLSKKVFRFAKSRLGEQRARAMALKIKKIRYLAKPRPTVTVAQAIALGDNSLYLQGQIVDIRHLIQSIELVFASGNSLHIDESIHYIRDESTPHRRALVQLGLSPGFVALIKLDNVPANANDAISLRFTLKKRGTQTVSLKVAKAANAPLEYVKRLLATVPGHSPEKRNLFDNIYGPALQEVWATRTMQRPGVEDLQFNDELAPTKPVVTLVIPIYGRYDFIEHQLSVFVNDESMKKHEILYVIDDPRIVNEIKGSCDALSRIYPIAFRVLCLERNMGYAGANNVGVEYAKGRSILLMNSDVMPSENGWLDELLETVGDSLETSITGARLVYEDRTVQHDGMRFYASPFVNHLWTNIHPGKGLPMDLFDDEDPLLPREAVTGACLLITRENYLGAGGFNENYILGDYEDSDLCMRGRQLGLKIQLASRIVLFHLERQSQSLMTADRWKEELTYYNCWQHFHTWNEDIQNMKRTGTDG